MQPTVEGNVPTAMPIAKRLLVIILCGMLLGGCSKRETVPEPGARTSEDDERSFFRYVLGEHVQLLAAKHQIPPLKADAVAWAYFRAHVGELSALAMKNETATAGNTRSLYPESGKGVRKTITELATQHELKEETVAAFLADLRLFQRAGRGL